MKTLIALIAALAIPGAVALAQPPAEGEATVSLRGAPAPKIEMKAPQLRLLMTLEYMRQVINPAANAYWATAGSLDPDGGEGVVGGPEYEEDWTDQLSRAAILMEAGNGLHTAGRIRNGRCVDNAASTCDAVWNYYAQELIDGGAAGMAAARAKDAVAAFEAGSLIYDSCYGCHARFIPRPANSRYTAPFPTDEEIESKGGVRGQ